MVRRDLAATAVPLSTGHLAHHGLQTPLAALATSKGGITKLTGPLLVVLVSVRMLVRGW